MKKEKNNVSMVWMIGFLCVAFSRGLVFRIPYLRSVFYEPMRTEFQLSHTQIAHMMSVYSVVKLLLYIPCGIIGDRMGTRKTLTFSLGMMAALSLWYAWYPGYYSLLVIQGSFGVAVNLAVPAMIKALRYFGGKNAQGKAFGFAETCRGIGSLAINFAALAIYSRTVSFGSPMRPVLLIHAAVYAGLAAGVWKTCPDTEQDAEGNSVKPGWKDYIGVLKMPAVWMITLLTMASYCLEILNEYTTPYLTHALGMTVVAAGVTATFRSYGISLFTGPVFGIVNDRFKSYSRTIRYISVLQFLVGVGLVVIPAKPSYCALGVALAVLGAIGVDGFASTQFCTFEECGIPPELTGTVTTVVCALGYTPDIWLSPIVGSYLDANTSPEAYRHVFRWILLFALLSVFLAHMTGRFAVRHKQEELYEN